MDEIEKKEALIDETEIDSFISLVESCDSEETKLALEETLLGNE